MTLVDAVCVESVPTLSLSLSRQSQSRQFEGAIRSSLFQNYPVIDRIESFPGANF